MAHASTELQDALTGYLESRGIDQWRVVQGKKHKRLFFTVEGKERFYVFSGTPSDGRRGILNAITDLRNMIGREEKAPPKPRRRPKLVAPVRVNLAIPPLTPGRDWKAGLLEALSDRLSADLVIPLIPENAILVLREPLEDR